MEREWISGVEQNLAALAAQTKRGVGLRRFVFNIVSDLATNIALAMRRPGSGQKSVHTELTHELLPLTMSQFRDKLLESRLGSGQRQAGVRRKATPATRAWKGANGASERRPRSLRLLYIMFDRLDWLLRPSSIEPSGLHRISEPFRLRAGDFSMAQ